MPISDDEVLKEEIRQFLTKKLSKSKAELFCDKIFALPHNLTDDPTVQSYEGPFDVAERMYHDQFRDYPGLDTDFRWRLAIGTAIQMWTYEKTASSEV